jgi:galactokinase
MEPAAQAARDRFQAAFESAPQSLAFAPGRIEFIGNHTDYNGGLVLGAAIGQGLGVAASKRADGAIVVCSASARESVRVAAGALQPLRGEGAWANYPLGVLAELRKLGHATGEGFNIAVASDLPSGAGLSSSAAFELATLSALTPLIGLAIERGEAARLCRRAENEFVGVPCGILDQGVCAFGQPDHLVRIDCATETFDTVALPAGVCFHIFNTHSKHSLVDSLYAERHRECMAARDALAAAYCGITHLAQASLDQLDAAGLPEPLQRRARHVLTEQLRVLLCIESLHAGDMGRVGSFLHASHTSSRDDFENTTAELDFLVEQLNGSDGVWGARLTGGGFGGAALAVTTESFGAQETETVQTAYRDRFGEEVTVLATRSGAGAHLVVESL